MEIKKADSKGRVSGFEAGQHYALDREKGYFSKIVVLAPDERPVEEALEEALKNLSAEEGDKLNRDPRRKEPE